MAFSLFIFLIVSVVLIGLLCSFILAVINLAKSHNQNVLDIRQILRAYSYLVCGTSVIILTIGLSLTFKSALSYVVGPQFSYRMDTYYAPQTYGQPSYAPPGTDTKPVTIEGQQFYGIDSMRNQDLINGIAMSLTSAFFILVHGLLLWRLNYRSPGFLGKIYNFNMLALFSISSLIFIPMGLYALINYMFFYTASSISDYSRLLPGEFSVIALICTIFWMYYLVKIVLRFPILKKRI